MVAALNAPAPKGQEKHTRPSTPREQFPRPDDATLRAWLHRHYGEHHGWVELFWIDGSPKDKQTRTGQDWRWYDPAKPLTIDQVARSYSNAVARYGNVYLSVGLYREQKRSDKALAYLPGVFVDDYIGGAALPANDMLMTSKGNAQAFWYIEGGIDADTYRALGRSAAHATGGGANSSNPCHLIRPPGSINRKPERNNYAAHWRHNSSAPAYTVDQLAAAFPVQANPHLVLVPDLPEETRTQIDYWREHIDHLLNEQKIPRRLRNPRSQARRVLTGELSGFDADSSLKRAVLMRGLLLHGYPQAEAVALCCELVPPARGQNDTWLVTDCLRLFEKERARLGEKYTPSSSRPKGKPSPFKNTDTDTPARPRGRPAEDTTTWEGLELWYAEEMNLYTGKVDHTVSSAANSLEVPRIQIERAEREGRRLGRMRRVVSADRGSSWVELIRGDDSGRPRTQEQGQQDAVPGTHRTRGRYAPGRITASADESTRRDTAQQAETVSPFKNADIPEYGAATPETTTEDVQCKEHAHARKEHYHTPSGVCSPPTPPEPTELPPQRPLAELVRMLVDSDPLASFGRVWDYCQARGYDDTGGAREAFRFAKQQTKIQGMSDKHLDRAITSAATAMAEYAQDKRFWFWRRRHILLKGEQEQRRKRSAAPPPETPDEQLARRVVAMAAAGDGRYVLLCEEIQDAVIYQQTKAECIRLQREGLPRAY